VKPQYVKIPKIYNKLKDAEIEHRTIYISAPVAVGKSVAAKYYLRNKDYLYLSGNESFLAEMLPYDDIWQSAILIDDISWITDSVSQSYILNLIAECEKHEKDGKLLILIGRSHLPAWLKGACIEYGFILADENDLIFGEEQIQKLFALHNITLSDADTRAIYHDTEGYPLHLICITYHMEHSSTYTAEIATASQLDMFHYFYHGFYQQWAPELKSFLISLMPFPSFSIELAEFVSGSENALRILNEASSIGSFVIKEESSYKLRPLLRKFLKWKVENNYSIEEQNKLYHRGGLYYETQDNLEKALFYYKKANAFEDISRLLIENAKKHVGTDHYYETREYYFSLSNELIQQSPVLMSGMSLLHSLLLQVEQSEHWYAELSDYAKKQPYNSESKTEAEIRCAYLDIALPHRNHDNIIPLIKSASSFLIKRGKHFPEFSATSNLPSIMNGGLDFCEWSKRDRELAIIMKTPLKMVLGNYFPGLVDIALAESLYEKSYSRQDASLAYEITELLNNGYALAATNGKIEMCFVATFVMVKIHISHNRPQTALELIIAFRKKVIEEHALQLLPNLDAAMVWLQLVTGEKPDSRLPSAESWLVHDAPDENDTFCVLDRFRYMVKVRVYMVMGKYAQAIALIERLNVYFERYHRTYFWMENQLLKAITQYRLLIPTWPETLEKALLKTQEYHFTKIISMKGIAILPLLEQARNFGLNKDYYDIILQDTKNLSVAFPDYLKEHIHLREPLTPTEQTILQLMCRNTKSADICELCGFTYNTLKYHNKNIYRKLGVSSRIEAVKAAIASNLCQI